MAVKRNRIRMITVAKTKVIDYRYVNTYVVEIAITLIKL